MAKEMEDEVQNAGDGPGKIREEARAWLTLFYCEETDQNDRLRFSEWLRRSDRHAEIFAEAEKMWNRLALSPELQKEAAGHVYSLEETRKKRAGAERQKFVGFFDHRRTFGAVAASLLVVFAFYAAFRPGDVQVDRFRTALGEIKNITLADGTTVVLNAESSLEARISDGMREVSLHGGAYFDVSHDKDRPFRVSVAGTEVKVLGTAFEVWEGPRTVRVSVTRGLVEVGEEEKARAMAGAETAASAVRLKAGEQVIASLDGRPGKVHDFDTDKALAWKNGHLSYIDVPLEDIIADVNRYRQKKIIITDVSLGALRVTTAFKVDQAEKMLRGLSLNKPLIIQEKKSGIYIRPKEYKF